MKKPPLVVKSFLLLMFIVGVATPGQTMAQARRKNTPGTKSVAGTKSSNGKPLARWVGQTGKDYVGKETIVKPDHIQDVQIHLSGIPIARLVNITLKGNGSGEWQWAPDGKPPGGWAMHLIPDSVPGQAELFFQNDREETGREFELKWTVKGQAEQSLYFQGGTADPAKPVASAVIVAKWLGQTADHPVDLTNRSAGVGPDGFEDAVIELDKLSEKDGVAAVDMETADGSTKWSYGLNPQAVWSAELQRSTEHPTTARFIFSVPTDENNPLNSKSLKIRVRYASSAVSEATLTGGRADGDRAMPAVKLPAVTESTITSQWSGSQRKSKAGPGAVKILLSRIPAQARVNSVVVTDPTGNFYAAMASGEKSEFPEARPLVFERSGADKGSLEFLPESDLNGKPISVRLQLADGQNMFLTINGGQTDLQQRVPSLKPGHVRANPGDDLQTLVNHAGTIVLGDGQYKLSRPLLIDKPTRIEAAPNAKPSLIFGPGQATGWTAAIKIRSGGVNLSGFAITFAGPIPWDQDVAYGPAVIATTDNRDTGFNHDAPHWGLTLEKLTIQGPPVPRKADPNQPPEAVKLVRILNGHLGRVEGCVLKGGSVHLANGPWIISQNRHDGPLPGSFTWDAFAVMRPHDVSVESNRVEPIANSGKLWRFMNLTQHGSNIRVAGNLVRNVGPKTGDSIADMNANEIFLTESYRIKYEGEPAQTSADGRILHLPASLAEPPQPGDKLSILTGPNRGRFHSVLQPLGQGNILIDPPLDAKDRTVNPPVVSLSTGFRDMAIDRNTIDATGSDTAFNIVLAGNHFGTEVTGNTLIGGGESLRITAFPTEFPNIWGWTHAPMMGLKITDNIVTKAAKPARIAVDFNPTIKTSGDRCYFFAEFNKNQMGRSGEGPAMQLGDPGIKIPGCLIVNFTGNKSPDQGAEVKVVSGTVNGKTLTDSTIDINSGPTASSATGSALKR